ncbi:MAG: 16S rRNA (cytosine(1402)-N(4))-methyltransferase RsmH [Chloroflexota bacterium]
MPVHIPVLLEEVLRALAVQPGGRYIDCTVGGGGHAEAILERSSTGGQLLGIDADPEAIAAAGARLERFTGSRLLVQGNFASLKAIALKYDFTPVHGILFDLGLSTLQLESDRGFSFQKDSPLDMRFDTRQEVTASDLVNSLSETELERILRTCGEEPSSRRIAQGIVAERPIKTTLELASVIERAAGGRRGRLHPATRTFQALRLATNRELENLGSALGQAVDLLGFGGRLAVTSYHSLEDRIVKQFMLRESRDCICPPDVPACVCEHKARLRLVTKKPVVPSAEEIRRNPRSRSAKLRAAERIEVAQEESLGLVEKLCFAIETGSNGWRQPNMLRRLREAF